MINTIKKRLKNLFIFTLIIALNIQNIYPVLAAEHTMENSTDGMTIHNGDVFRKGTYNISKVICKYSSDGTVNNETSDTYEIDYSHYSNIEIKFYDNNNHEQELDNSSEYVSYSRDDNGYLVLNFLNDSYKYSLRNVEKPMYRTFRLNFNIFQDVDNNYNDELKVGDELLPNTKYIFNHMYDEDGNDITFFVSPEKAFNIKATVYDKELYEELYDVNCEGKIVYGRYGSYVFELTTPEKIGVSKYYIKGVSLSEDIENTIQIKLTENEHFNITYKDYFSEEIINELAYIPNDIPKKYINSDYLTWLDKDGKVVDETKIKESTILYGIPKEIDIKYYDSKKENLLETSRASYNGSSDYTDIKYLVTFSDNIKNNYKYVFDEDNNLFYDKSNVSKPSELYVASLINSNPASCIQDGENKYGIDYLKYCNFLTTLSPTNILNIDASLNSGKLYYKISNDCDDIIALNAAQKFPIYCFKYNNLSDKQKALIDNIQNLTNRSLTEEQKSSFIKMSYYYGDYYQNMTPKILTNDYVEIEYMTEMCVINENGEEEKINANNLFLDTSLLNNAEINNFASNVEKYNPENKEIIFKFPSYDIFNKLKNIYIQIYGSYNISISKSEYEYNYDYIPHISINNDSLNISDNFTITSEDDYNLMINQYPEIKINSSSGYLRSNQSTYITKDNYEKLVSNGEIEDGTDYFYKNCMSIKERNKKDIKETVNALGHIWNADDWKLLSDNEVTEDLINNADNKDSLDLTDIANKEVYRHDCNRANDAYELKVSDHTAGDSFKENEVLPTCTKDGSYDLVTKCTGCGKEISRINVKVNALGHIWNADDWELLSDDEVTDDLINKADNKDSLDLTDIANKEVYRHDCTRANDAYELKVSLKDEPIKEEPDTTIPDKKNDVNIPENKKDIPMNIEEKGPKTGDSKNIIISLISIAITSLFGFVLLTRKKEDK